MDRVRACQDLLTEIDELSQQKETQIARLAVCEGVAQERRRTMLKHRDTDTDTASKTVRSLQANLSEHKHLVTGHVRNIKKLQLACRELVLGLLGGAEPRWLRCRRETLVAALGLARDIHVMIMRRGGDGMNGWKRKQGVGKGPRGGRRGRKG